MLQLSKTHKEFCVPFQDASVDYYRIFNEEKTFHSKLVYLLKENYDNIQEAFLKLSF